MDGLKRKSPLTGISGLGEWCRGTESNCRHGDFQPKMLVSLKIG